MNYPFESDKKGLLFIPGGIYLDPKRSALKAVISHAHADHANPYNKEVWCTSGTYMIMKARYGEKLKTKFNIVSYNEPFQIDEITITLYPAGHILGSAQIVIDHNNVRYCYTGDFKLRPDSTCEAFEIVKCDVLITETTFANPEYSHPDESSEFNKLKNYPGYNLVIGAYSLGKAQRLTSLLNLYCPERRIMVHHEAIRFHKLYEQSGFKLGDYVPYNYRLFRNSTGNVLVVPPRALSTYSRESRVMTAFATGWKNPPFKGHFMFHLSDHADWNEVLELVKKSEAKEIYTVHGHGSFLKKHLESVI